MVFTSFFISPFLGVNFWDSFLDAVRLYYRHRFGRLQ